MAPMAHRAANAGAFQSAAVRGARRAGARSWAPRRRAPADRRQSRVLAGYSRSRLDRADDVSGQEGNRRVGAGRPAGATAGRHLYRSPASARHSRGQRANRRGDEQRKSRRAVRRSDHRRRQSAAAFSLVAFRGGAASGSQRARRRRGDSAGVPRLFPHGRHAARPTRAAPRRLVRRHDLFPTSGGSSRPGASVATSISARRFACRSNPAARRSPKRPKCGCASSPTAPAGRSRLFSPRPDRRRKRKAWSETPDCPY